MLRFFILILAFFLFLLPESLCTASEYLLVADDVESPQRSQQTAQPRQDDPVARARHLRGLASRRSTLVVPVADDAAGQIDRLLQGAIKQSALDILRRRSAQGLPIDPKQIVLLAVNNAGHTQEIPLEPLTDIRGVLKHRNAQLLAIIGEETDWQYQPGRRYCQWSWENLKTFGKTLYLLYAATISASARPVLLVMSFGRAFPDALPDDTSPDYAYTQAFIIVLTINSFPSEFENHALILQYVKNYLKEKAAENIYTAKTYKNKFLLGCTAFYAISQGALAAWIFASAELEAPENLLYYLFGYSCPIFGLSVMVDCLLTTYDTEARGDAQSLPERFALSGEVSTQSRKSDAELSALYDVIQTPVPDSSEQKTRSIQSSDVSAEVVAPGAFAAFGLSTVKIKKDEGKGPETQAAQRAYKLVQRTIDTEVQVSLAKAFMTFCVIGMAEAVKDGLRFLNPTWYKVLAGILIPPLSLYMVVNSDLLLRVFRSTTRAGANFSRWVILDAGGAVIPAVVYGLTPLAYIWLAEGDDFDFLTKAQDLKSLGICTLASLYVVQKFRLTVDANRRFFARVKYLFGSEDTRKAITVRHGILPTVKRIVYNAAYDFLKDASSLVFAVFG